MIIKDTIKNVVFGIVLLSVFQIVFNGLSENTTWSPFVTLLFPVVLFCIYSGVKFATFVIGCLTDSITVYGEVTNGEANYMYQNLLYLIGDQMKSREHRLPYFAVDKRKNRRLDSESFYFSRSERNGALIAKYTPSFGYHIFNYDGKWILLERKQRCDISYNGNTGESVKLTTLKKNKDVLEKIIEKLIPEVPKPKGGTTNILNCDNNGHWQQNRQPVKQRLLPSVILPAGNLENVISDIKSYLSKREWYSDRGIPHRRGYLLYGPPGNGKSSCITAIAGELNCDICIMSLNSPGLTDNDLDRALNNAPKKSIILLEDIDAAFKSRKDETATSRETNLAFEGNQSCITFRGLLNALDGVGSMEGRIVFMTSNHADKLDPALIRPGRVDVKVLIDYPNEEQIRRMFNRFFPKENHADENHLELENSLVLKIMSIPQPVSMSMIQGLFIIYTESPQQVIDNIPDYFNNIFSVSYSEPNKAEK